MILEVCLPSITMGRHDQAPEETDGVLRRWVTGELGAGTLTKYGQG